jgi:hypothetical protein
MWSQEQAEKLWSLTSVCGSASFFAGALGSQELSGSHEHRHKAFSQERFLMCWDTRGSCLVRVTDWRKDEYWGERVLVVQEYAPNNMGLSWDRRQSALWELGEQWQGIDASLALRRLSDHDKAELCAHVSSWWKALQEAKELERERTRAQTDKASPARKSGLAL